MSDAEFHVMEQYFPPIFEGESFHCPNCGVYARQYWGLGIHDPDTVNRYEIENLQIALCERCNLQSYWIEKEMIYPISSTAPMPSPDMPKDVEADFLEARNVLRASPRAAAALLRLALQKLMPHLGEKGDKINDDIASLVEKGLTELIQKALDSLRVIGNDAVHPGQMDLKDDNETATALFDLLNFIIVELITNPKRITAIYDKLPESKRKAIKTRDKT